MLEKDIHDLTKEEIINSNLIESIYTEYPNENERNEVILQVMDRARELRIVGKFKNSIDRYNKDIKLQLNNIMPLLEIGQDGKVEKKVNNYIIIMNNDPFIQKLFVYNCFSDKILKIDEDKPRVWTDSDDSMLRAYIETNYDLYDIKKYHDAFNTVLLERKVHPLKNLIESGEWDGKPRIDNFLKDILECDEDEEYLREVSRMIFYGGISRLYSPGCKFDYVPILISPQGSGKSTIVKWLSLDEQYSPDIYTIEGKEGMELLQGAWICEMAELVAMVKTKEVEAMKSFITKTMDAYRPAYSMHKVEMPRTCIFIGTTNDYEFLSDMTGNRRYLPVRVCCVAHKLFKNERYIKDYIYQCWQEALYLFRNNKIYLTIPYEYSNKIKNVQERSMEDDPLSAYITNYLNEKKVGDKVCNYEIFTNCMNGIRKNYQKGDGKKISKLLNSLPDWKKIDGVYYAGSEYGKQRGWEKIDINKFEDLD